MPRNDAGFFLGPDAPSMLQRALSIRDEVVRLLSADGFHEQANRLLISGEAGQPDEEDFPYIARALGFAFEVVQPDIPMAPLVYGNGPVALRVLRHLQKDPAGHASWHYVVEQAWRPVSAKRRRIVGKTSSAGVVSISHPVDLPTMKEQQPPS